MRLLAAICLCAAIALSLSSAWAGPDVKVVGDTTSTEVTVYNDNLGLVKDRRSVDLVAGRNVIELIGIPSQIEASSLALKSLTDPGGLRVFEQDYQYDLVDKGKLLSKYIGKRVWFRFRNEGDKKIKEEPPKEKADEKKGDAGKTPFQESVPQAGVTLGADDTWTPPLLGNEDRFDRFVSGILMVSGGEYIIVMDDGRIVFNPGGQLELPSLPSGIRLKPTLVWKVDAGLAGKHDIEVAYLTSGLTWSADYVAILDNQDTALDVTGWVTLANTSGATYKDAKLKLVAGDLNRAREPGILGRYAEQKGAQPPAQPVAEETDLYEYHMYTVPEPTTIADSETKLVSFLEAKGVKTRKVYVYDSDYAHAYGFRGDTSRQTKVQVKAEVLNTTGNNLGQALPKGRVRVYQADTDGQLQFIGEDVIDHTPRDQKVRFTVGNAFDLYGERIRIDYRRIGTKNEEDFVITLRNAKDEAVEITVVEHLYGDWDIYAKSHEFVKKDAHTVEFTVRVPARGDAKLTYSCRTVF